MTDENMFTAVVGITLIVLLLVAVIVIVFFVAGKQRIRQQMQLAETKLQYEQELRSVETEVSEQMMAHFAQELHDNIGQLHTAMHIQIENQKLDYPALAENFKPLEIYLGEATQQLRMLSRTLNHDFIGSIGLFAAIQMEADRLNGLKRFQLHVKIGEGDSNLNRNQELMVFRIFQELTQNALRHANAKNMYLSIDNSNEGFEMEVRDDGKGFDLIQVLELQRASGIKNMMKRARLGGLNFNIESEIGKGCAVVISKKAER